MATLRGYARQVRDALAARYMEGTGCFRSNRSCRLLQEDGTQVLPAIEEAILKEVLPYYHCTTESLDQKFPGLLSVLVTYFAIGKDAGEDRVLQFFGRLCGSVRVEAMLAINTVWLWRAPTAPIPDQLLTAVRALAEEGSGKVQEVARWLLGRAGQ